MLIQDWNWDTAREVWESEAEGRVRKQLDSVIADKDAALADKDAALADRDTEIARLKALLGGQ